MDRANEHPPAVGRNELPPPLSRDDKQDPVEMLDSIASFLRRYLICDEHQLTILTLWIVHTWCYQQFLTTAYLDVRSPEPHSGKSRCLELLNELCNSPALLTAAGSETIQDRLLHERSMEEITNDQGISLLSPHTMLLDNCHYMIGSSERQPLLAMLTSGVCQTSRYAFGYTDYCLFGPKAFAGNGRLPHSLAACCIPMVLRRKKPSELVARFTRNSDSLPARVRDWLENVEKHPSLAPERAMQAPPGLPSDLTPRQQDCAEPLLHVANMVGGPWPKKAFAAISAIFQASECSDSLQVLADVRAWFFMNKDPEYLLTRDLLPLLTSMDQRPWSGWLHESGRKLGALLHPFGIFSRRLNIGDQKGIKGYLRADFQDAWERYLPPLRLEQQMSSSSKTGA
ncbi:MAG TPA: DUF3631 domain-containing protein [Candidatus Angelobacter sp.]